MGLLTDILKEIPQAAVLKEKIADIEAKYAAADTENAILKDDLRQAKAEITKLKKQVEQFSYSDLTDIDVSILQTIAVRGTSDSDIVAHDLTVHFQKAQLHLNTLAKAGYIRGFYDENGSLTYRLCDRARRYLDENDLFRPPATK